MSRRVAYLASVLGAAWLLRMLWVRYGQHSRSIRLFNRGMLNPVTLVFAGRPCMPYAVLYHIGRRSGKSYATPLLVQAAEHSWVIPLTYGEMTDWYRNIKQAGSGIIEWQGRRYRAEMPEWVDAARALPAFPLVLRLALRIAGIKQFVRLHQTSVDQKSSIQ